YRVEMADSRDPVWEHGENIRPGWRCKYCHTKRGGGGATQLKQHLATRGKGVTYCNSVPPDVREFFKRSWTG
ncbi:Os06g0328650, partial [Oryza sativa Japonica Group]